MSILTNWVEIVGYTGTVLIAVSLMMSSIVRLRWINMFGASTFATYGLLTETYPVFALNSFITLVDIYYLLQMRRKSDYFEFLEITNLNSPFLKRFIEYHHDDIQKYFPEFKAEFSSDFKVIFILRNLLPVGLFIGEPGKDDQLQIHLDYVIPDYRDMKSAHFLFFRGHAIFDESRYRYFITHSKIDEHTNYLKKLGFKEDSSLGENWYRRKISETV